MCGITGIYDPLHKNGISLDTLKKMTAILSHRGPDESGLYLDNQIGLGHTRLSIIDLSHGSQPIHNEDETMWIVYNGEVYNYLELRDRLCKKGHTFYTTSDTEVVLHLYEEEGPEALREMNGQFAFAIWDAKKRELFLARDRMGIRPLHYINKNGSLLFASEIKSLFACKSIAREIDSEAMGQIFTFWTTLPGKTIFRDVQELPPGHYLTARDGRVSVKKYWEIPLYRKEEQVDTSPEQISNGIKDVLADAVRLRLRADVPVGCYLSGGLDSAALAALILQQKNCDLQTFGIRFEETAFDEGKYQQQVSRFLGSAHQEIQATNAGIKSTFPKVIWHCEKPLLRTAPAPLFLLSGLVRHNNLKVVLTGEGADEIFGGYNIFREAKVRAFWARCPSSSSRAALAGRLYPYIFKSPRSRLFLQGFLRRSLAGAEDPLYSHMARWANTSRAKMFFSENLKGSLQSHRPYEDVMEHLPPIYNELDYLAKAKYLETSIFMSNYLLASQGDRMAMANSVEIRLPYLDHRVIDFMARVPSKWKLLGLKEKYILKKSFKGILPESIVDRDKHPYHAPVKESLVHANTEDYVHEMLSERSLKQADLFDVNRVNRLLNKAALAENLSEVESMALVGILSSQLVYHQFVQNFAVPSAHSLNPNVVVDKRSIA